MKNASAGKLLVVDDSEEYRKSLCTILKIQNYEVVEAASVTDANRYLESNHCDVVLVDVKLNHQVDGDISGWEIARKAGECFIPCIMITAYPSVEVENIFLNARSGRALAVDFVQKKDGPLAVLGAIQAVLSRPGNHRPVQEPLLVIDEDMQLVTLRGEKIELSQNQYDLLHCLAQKRGAVTGSREIIQAVYGQTLTEVELKNDSRLERLVVRVRQKIEDDPAEPRFLRTEKGRGYRLLVTGEEIPPESPG